MMKKLLPLILYLMLSSCGYDKFDNHTPPGATPAAPNTTIAELNTLYQGKPTAINKDYIVQGYVTSSDKGNNFFKSFVIQDHSGSIEIMAGLYNLHNSYPLGSHITVQTMGLTLGSYNSVTQLGIANRSSSAGDVDYIGYRSEVNRYVTRGTDTQKMTPIRLELSAVQANLCGKLVTIDNIQFTDADAAVPPPWHSSEFGGSTFNRFTDLSDNQIYVVCSAYADFASGIIPLGNLSITGILYYGSVAGHKNVYILKPRDINDLDAL